MSGRRRDMSEHSGWLRPWKHGNGAERTLLRRSSLVNDPHRSLCNRSFGAGCACDLSSCVWFRFQTLGGNAHGSRVVSKQKLLRRSDRREPVLDGNIGGGASTETDMARLSLSCDGDPRAWSLKTPFPKGDRWGCRCIQPIGC